MNPQKIPPESLLKGRRALEKIPEYLLLDDLKWYKDDKRWVMKCRLTLDTEGNEHIPPTTDWYIHIPDQYPFGDIKFYPSEENGITSTYQHQQLNSNISQKLWRDGKLCLDTSVKSLGQVEPNSTYQSENRLAWYVQRAIGWLTNAINNTLNGDNDYFELPDFLDSKSSSTFIFSEDNNSYQLWKNITLTSGLTDLLIDKKNPTLLALYGFNFKKQGYFPRHEYGVNINKFPDKIKAIWVYLNTVPVIEPWQTPTNYFELREVLKKNSFDFNHILGMYLDMIRKEAKSLMIIGFPIKKRINEDDIQIHWQALELKNLLKKQDKGFKNLTLHDLTYTLTNNTQLTWLKSENWNEKEISSRGKFKESLKNKSILLVGVGALGSVVAELLVRGGISNITLIDPDLFNMGNAVRHTLTIDSISRNKAEEVAVRLNKANPQAKVCAVKTDFSSFVSEQLAKLESYEVIIDCTANREVLMLLERQRFFRPKIFFSASLGIELKKLYIFSQSGSNFSYHKYEEQMEPWRKKQEEEYDIKELPKEGVGCWNPIFPGRIDSLFSMSGIMIKSIESYIINPKTIMFTVFEEKHDGEIGIEQVYKHEE